MKYIKNTGRYSLAFVIMKNKREVTIELPRRQLFQDTGNIAIEGITPVEEADLKALQEQKRFKAEVKAGSLVILEESEVRTPEETKIKELERVNKELNEKLKKAENADIKKVEAERDRMAQENDNLKAQLEALKKAPAGEDVQPTADTVEQPADEAPASDGVDVDTEGF